VVGDEFIVTLDVGEEKNGDCLVQVGCRNILIGGARCG
jgi:hypothetical protein